MNKFSFFFFNSLATRNHFYFSALICCQVQTKYITMINLKCHVLLASVTY